MTGRQSNDDMLKECLEVAALIHAADLNLGRPVRTMETAAILHAWLKSRREKGSEGE